MEKIYANVVSEKRGNQYWQNRQLFKKTQQHVDKFRARVAFALLTRPLRLKASVPQERSAFHAGEAFEGGWECNASDRAKRLL